MNKINEKNLGDGYGIVDALRVISFMRYSGIDCEYGDCIQWEFDNKADEFEFNQAFDEAIKTL